MNEFLKITVTFLQPLAHGRRDGGEPEWPPSPLRLFQALVAAAAARWNERTLLGSAGTALEWLERQTAMIIGCAGTSSTVPTQFYVPDNSADTLVSSWKRGETKKVPKRTEKVVRPTHLQGDTLHYLYPLDVEGRTFFEILQSAAQSVTHLGWGIDLVAANAEIIDAIAVSRLAGERWDVAQSGGVPLRVPVAGTLGDLSRKHSDFLQRMAGDSFNPVPPLREFAVRRYRSSQDIPSRPHCVFQILKPDASGNRAFHTARRTRDVAAWIRHAVDQVCRGAQWDDFAAFVHGHGPDGRQNKALNSSQRFQYLPLPTVNSKLNRVETIRRVMVAAPIGCEDRIDFIRRRLLGHPLIWNSEEIGILNLQTGKDWVREQYTTPSRTWSSVTPVILDGYDDQNPGKTLKLLQKALRNAGIAAEVEFEWQPFGYRAGVEPVRAFVRPENLHGTMVHVRLRFSHSVPGPLALGAGRYRGFGLLVADPES